MISHLSIWNQPDNTGLDWYRNVADNKLPAKYLLAKRVAVPDDFLNHTTDHLWKIHEDATQHQLHLQQEILSSTNPEKIFKNYHPVSPSLIDLNIELVNRMLTTCNFCQWNCEVDRSGFDFDENKKTGACQLGEESRVGSYFHHRGEELIYRGSQGSGTIFFTSCNMRCTFCQNGNISQDKNNGLPTSPQELAAIMWLLRMEGCHNINFVGGDPTIHLHTILRSFQYLSADGPSIDMLQKIQRMKSDRFVMYPINSTTGLYEEEFNAPMLWNANFFMTEQTMRLLRTVIDIWLPDFKFGTEKKCATRLSRTPWYWETVTRNLKMIHNWRENFTIRHLVMPNHVECCTQPILEWIGTNLQDIQVNIMDQYHPDSFTDPTSSKYNHRYSDISRRLTQKEFQRALDLANEYKIYYKTVSFS